MTTALELKNKIEKLDDKKALFDFIFQFGILPAALIFPIIFAINYQHIDPIVRSSLIWFGLGFVAFIPVCLTFSVFGLIIMHFTLSRYLENVESKRKFAVNSILKDDVVVRKMAKGIDLHLFNRMWMRFMLLIDWIFEEIKQGLRYEISESKKEVIAEVEKVRDESKQARKEDMFIIQQQGKTILQQNLEILQLNKEILKTKQLKQIISDTSFKVHDKQKKLDKFQTKLDEFIHEY